MTEFTLTTKHQVRAGDIAVIVAAELGIRHHSLVGILTEGENPIPTLCVKAGIKDLRPVVEIDYNGRPVDERSVIDGMGTKFTIKGEALTPEIFRRIQDGVYEI